MAPGSRVVLLAALCLAVRSAGAAVQAPFTHLPSTRALLQFVSSDVGALSTSPGLSAASDGSGSGGGGVTYASAAPAGYTLDAELTFAGFDASVGTLQLYALSRALAQALGLTAESQLSLTGPMDAVVDGLYVQAAVTQANQLVPSAQAIYLPGTAPPPPAPMMPPAPEPPTPPTPPTPPAPRAPAGRHLLRASSETTAVAPTLPGVSLSLSLVANSYASAVSVATSLAALFDSSPAGAAGFLVLAMKAQGLHNNPPFYVSGPGATVDPTTVIIYQGTTAPPPPAPPTPASPPPPGPPGVNPPPSPPPSAGALQNITGAVTLSGILPAAFGVIGTGVNAKVNASAPLVVLFRTVLASQLGVAANATRVTDINPVYGDPVPSPPPAAGRRHLLTTPAHTPSPPAVNKTATAVIGATVAYAASVNASLTTAAVQAKVASLFNAANGTFPAAFFTAARTTLASRNVTRAPNATSYSLLVGGISFNVSAPPSASAAAAAKAVARATVQLDGLTSTASTAVVAAVCGLTGFLLFFAIGYTIRETRRRDAELRKMNSVG